MGLNGQEMACLHKEHKIIIALQLSAIKKRPEKHVLYRISCPEGHLVTGFLISIGAFGKTPDI